MTNCRLKGLCVKADSKLERYKLKRERIRERESSRPLPTTTKSSNFQPL